MDLIDTLSAGSLSSVFLPFCFYLSELHPQRFNDLFQKPLVHFMSAHWADPGQEARICVFLPQIIDSKSGPNDQPIKLPQAFEYHIVSKLEGLADLPFPEPSGPGSNGLSGITSGLPMYSAYLRILASTAVQPSTRDQVADLLLRKLKLALRPVAEPGSDEAIFIVGDGFKAYISMTSLIGDVDRALDPLLHAAAARYAHMPRFLEAMLAYKELLDKKANMKDTASDSIGDAGHVTPLVEALVRNLSSPSHELRLLSIQLLRHVNTAEGHAALSNMFQLEETPLSAQNTRSIGVQLRKLGQLYSTVPSGSWLLNAIPAFLFAMTTVRLSPVWDDAIEALKSVVQANRGEEAVQALAFGWLETPSFRPEIDEGVKFSDNDDHAKSDFECFNFRRLQSLASKVSDTIQNSEKALLDAFQATHTVVPGTSAQARQKALKVLAAIPSIAEKRSRQLVPHLLSWTAPQPSSDTSESDFDELSESDWSLSDRKLLLSVFSQFQNPKVLYASEAVYSALLKLLENGDVQVQKLALKSILAWKQDNVRPYVESLEFLLDDARLKNEITVVFQGDNQVRPEHKRQVMPILLRILYGRSIAKKQGGIRQTIIRSLPAEDIGAYLAVALGDLASLRVVDETGFRPEVIAKEVIVPRRQLGIMNMIDAVISELGSSLPSYMDVLVQPTLYCAFYASRQILADSDEVQRADTSMHISLLRDIRTTALKVLYKLFQNAHAFDWTPYQNCIVSEIISPRVDKLAADNTQGMSATWKLLETWATLPKTALFLFLDRRILPSLLACLSHEKTKAEVKVSALSIVRSLVKLGDVTSAQSEFDKLIRVELLEANLDLLLAQVGILLRSQISNDRKLLDAAVQTVLDVAPLVTQPGQARDMVEIAAFLLHQPTKNVPPKTKGAILLVLEHFVMLGDLGNNLSLRGQIEAKLSALFSFFKDRENRESLARVLRLFASEDGALEQVASLCAQLNSFSSSKIDLPDYDRRLLAFQAIARPRQPSFTLRQWLPLLHNLVFYLHKDEEFGVLASNSADGICRFIDAAETACDHSERVEFERALCDVVMPAIYSGARELSETVRRETLRVFGYLISHLRTWSPVADLSHLCPEDEQSDKLFFFNILSPAYSRQLQALHLLSQANERKPLSGRHISHYFIPLLEHFIIGEKQDKDDHGLGAQATSTIAALASSLDWNQYRAILRRYISYVDTKPDLQKQVIRLLERFTDVLVEAVSNKQSRRNGAMALNDSGLQTTHLSGTLPETSKMVDEISSSFLPVLLEYLHEKDEALVSARVPVGIIIIKLLNVMPADAMVIRLPGVLTDISHILRSKTVESRDMARDTLNKIALVLGPESFGFILKELRGALTRGPQLHVLSYTMHSLLGNVIPQFEHGSLDYCLPMMMSIIMDDVFGAISQEKEAEDYTNKMKEVKSSKSQDSLELIAKNASIDHLVDLIRPLKSLLMEKLDIRTARKIDELLNRITSGFTHNHAAENRRSLVFCYQVIQEAYESMKPEDAPKLDPKLKRYLIQRGAARGSERGATTAHTQKLVRFSIDIMRSLLRKHDSLRNAENLLGFLPILGDATLSAEDEVRNATFKLLAVIAKVPFPADEADDLYKVAAKEAIRAISSSTSIASDLAQSALKLLSVILRDHRTTPIKDAAVDILLARVKDDLTQPLLRHVSFTVLRAVLDRNIETATVYDVLDHVGTVMITNDDKDTRDLARGAFFQFLRDYPQKKSRWAKQLHFVVANLKYDREGGRLSVMEVIHLLLMKSADDFVQEVAGTCFIPLVFVLANDESERCCLAAAQLLKEIFKRADKERLKGFLGLMRGWTGKDSQENAAVVMLGLQTFGLYFETKGEETPGVNKDLALVVGRIEDILAGGTGTLSTELINTALRLVHGLLGRYPASVLLPGRAELWTVVQQCLTHDSASVRLTTVRLISAFLVDFAKTENGESSTAGLTGSYGLVLTQTDVFGIIRHGLAALAVEAVDEAFAEEVAKVLAFMGRRLATAPPNVIASSEDNDKGDDGESVEGEDINSSAPAQSLRYLLSRLSAIIREERPPKAQALVSKLSALDILDALCTSLPTAAILVSVKPILRALRNVTDPSIPSPFSTEELFKTRHAEVKTKAQTIMDGLQQKLGTSTYTANLLAVSGDVRERRVARSSKRKVAAVVDPERHGLEKRKKIERKKERRRERGREERSRRQGM
jgi:U3 small nucleolar RNA-associated protein 20